jgi:hypothetical protein
MGRSPSATQVHMIPMRVIPLDSLSHILGLQSDKQSGDLVSPGRST